MKWHWVILQFTPNSDIIILYIFRVLFWHLQSWLPTIREVSPQTSNRRPTDRSIDQEIGWVGKSITPVSVICSIEEKILKYQIIRKITWSSISLFLLKGFSLISSDPFLFIIKSIEFHLELWQFRFLSSYFFSMLKMNLNYSCRCLKFGKPVLCRHQFHQCEDSKPIASLCKRDCELFKQQHCRDELLLISKMGSSSWINMYIPDCSQLSDNNDRCVPIPTEKPEPGMTRADKLYIGSQYAFHNNHQEINFFWWMFILFIPISES